MTKSQKDQKSLVNNPEYFVKKKSYFFFNPPNNSKDTLELWQNWILLANRYFPHLYCTIVHFGEFVPFIGFKLKKETSPEESFFCRLRLCSKILDNCSFFSVTVFSLFFPLSLRLETSLNCHSQNPPPNSFHSF